MQQKAPSTSCSGVEDDKHAAENVGSLTFNGSKGSSEGCGTSGRPCLSRRTVESAAIADTSPLTMSELFVLSTFATRGFSDRAIADVDVPSCGEDSAVVNHFCLLLETSQATNKGNHHLPACSQLQAGELREEGRGRGLGGFGLAPTRA